MIAIPASVLWCGEFGGRCGALSTTASVLADYKCKKKVVIYVPSDSAKNNIFKGDYARAKAYTVYHL